MPRIDETIINVPLTGTFGLGDFRAVLESSSRNRLQAEAEQKQNDPKARMSLAVALDTKTVFIGC